MSVHKTGQHQMASKVYDLGLRQHRAPCPGWQCGHPERQYEGEPSAATAFTNKRSFMESLCLNKDRHADRGNTSQLGSTRSSGFENQEPHDTPHAKHLQIKYQNEIYLIFKCISN